MALAALPALVLADTARIGARGWRAPGPADSWLIGLAAAAAAAAFLPLAFRGARDFLGARWRQLALASASVLAALGLAELGAMRLAPWPGFHLQSAHVRILHRTDPLLMPGIEGPARYTTNALGIRGDEFPAERSVPRILCLGGSTTECLYLDDTETWPHLLGQRLASAGPVWVGAIGASGYSSVHHLKFLEQHGPVAAGEFDAVLMMVGVNDLGKVYLGVTEAQQLAGALKPIWGRSRLASLLHAGIDRWRAERTGALEDWAYHVPRQQRERAAATQIARGLDLERWLAEYAARIERIALLCSQRGLRLIFATQPVQWAAGLPAQIEARFWFGRLASGDYASTAVMRADMDAFNARLLEVCGRLGVPCVDLSPLHGDARWFFDDCHFTEAGARAVAGLIADWMLAHPEAWRPIAKE
jgi:lysophospholipase L1-like esterase